MSDEVEDREISEAKGDIQKIEYDIKTKINPSEMPVEERLEKLPGMIYVKAEQLRKESTKISNIKASIKHMVMNEVNRLRDQTVPGKKPEVMKPKYTVERAEFEAKKHLRKTNSGYRKAKEDERAMHSKNDQLTNEKEFLVNMFEAAKKLK